MTTAPTSHQCPRHGDLTPIATRYGVRWSCPAAGCTVACWGGPTSTPADAETRALRHRCHVLFDPLWRDRGEFRSRGAAYRWLARFLSVPIERAHIGMLDAGQCRDLIAALEARR